MLLRIRAGLPLALWLGLAGMLVAQVPPDPAPPPRAGGTEAVLRERLATIAEAACGGTKNPQIVQETVTGLLALDWSKVEVPRIIRDFATEREQALIDGHATPWGYDALPRELSRLATDASWAALFEKEMPLARSDLSDILNKRTLSRKKHTDALIRFRVLPKMLCCVAWGQSERLLLIRQEDLDRMHQVLRPAWKDFGLDTAIKSASYELMPSGLYLRYAAWLGDEAAWTLLRGMGHGYLDAPRPAAADNLLEAAQALRTLVTARLGDPVERERTMLIQALLTHAGVPDSVKAALRPKK